MLIVAGTLLAVLAAVAGVVSVAAHRMDAARKAADADFHPAPVVPVVAATQPAAEPDLPPIPQVASIELWAADGVPHGNVHLGTSGSGEHHKSSDSPVLSDKAAAKLRMKEIMGGHPVTTYLTDFHVADDFVTWNVELPKPGRYEIEMTYACPKTLIGGKFVVRLGDQELATTLDGTRGYTSFRVTTLGTLTLPAGKTTLTLRPALDSTKSKTFLNLRSIQIVPAL